MEVIISLLALAFMITAAYRGYSVILCAPIAALGAVLLMDPGAVAPVFNGIFMEKMVGFVKLYFPVFMLGAVFGKLIELSGFSKSIVAYVLKLIGKERAIVAIVIVSAILTYGGVSLFVVVFAVYPFAAEMFRQGSIPKNIIPGTIALGAFSFTMTSLPGSPQIQNIIPTGFFGTTSWAAPGLGLIAAAFTLGIGLTYLEFVRKRAMARGEGYGTDLVNEPAPFTEEKLPSPWLALTPLFLVGIMNYAFTKYIPVAYEKLYTLELPGLPTPLEVATDKLVAVWAVEAALIVGILFVLVSAFRTIARSAAEGSKAAVAGALLACMNTASEFGFGGVIAALPGFVAISGALTHIPNPLLNEAITINVLAAITGSASGGLSIALAAMSDTFIQAAEAAKIPLEVLHRVASLASGGMDNMPHNGGVITLLAVTGLTHRQAYKHVFMLTVVLTTVTSFFIILVHYLTGIV